MNRLDIKCLLLLISCILVHASISNGAILHVVEIVPTTQSDYTVSKELEQVRASYRLALNDYKKIDQTCALQVKEKISLGSEEVLSSYIKEISKDGGVLIGLSRSNFARIGAKAAQGERLQGISIGAAAANISLINPNFTSIVSPLSSQWAALSKEMENKKCIQINTVGIFDSEDFLSSEFKAAYLKTYSKALDHNEFEQTLSKGIHCIFMGVNFSQAQEYLTKLSDSKIEIYGVGDWNYYSKELHTFIKNKNKWHITIPTGWVPNSSLRDKRFSEKIKIQLHEAPSPIAAYTYDSTLVALKSICENKNVNDFKITDLKNLPLLRNYMDKTPSNFIAPMNILKVNGVQAK